MDFNYNASECIKHASYWGFDKYWDICHDKVHVIEWGQVDYMWAGAFTIVAGGFVLTAVALTVAAFRDALSYRY